MHIFVIEALLYVSRFVVTVCAATTSPTVTFPCLNFFFIDAAPSEIYTLSLHDALPILLPADGDAYLRVQRVADGSGGHHLDLDRKSTRLNSSHPSISYAVFCLKKKKTPPQRRLQSLFPASISSLFFRSPSLSCFTTSLR